MPQLTYFLSVVTSSILSPYLLTTEMCDHLFWDYVRHQYILILLDISHEESLMFILDSLILRYLMLDGFFIQQSDTAVWWNHNTNTRQQLQNHQPNAIPVTCLYVLTITSSVAGKGNPFYSAERVVPLLYDGHQVMIKMDKILSEQLHWWAGGSVPGGGYCESL